MGKIGKRLNGEPINSVGGGRLVAYDLGTGALLWTYVSGGGASAPVVSGRAVYVKGNDGTVYRLDGATGAVQWHTQPSPQARAAYDPNSIQLPPVIAGRLVFADAGHAVNAYDLVTGVGRWTAKAPTGQPLAMIGTTLYTLSLGGTMEWFDVATGARRGSAAVRGSDFALPAVSDGAMIAAFVRNDNGPTPGPGTLPHGPGPGVDGGLVAVEPTR